MRWSWRARSIVTASIVVIGGVAKQVHGHVRTTQDLDTIAAWTPESMRALAGAPAELEARLAASTPSFWGLT